MQEELEEMLPDDELPEALRKKRKPKQQLMITSQSRMNESSERLETGTDDVALVRPLGSLGQTMLPDILVGKTPLSKESGKIT
jgi:hypothetical protein